MTDRRRARRGNGGARAPKSAARQQQAYARVDPRARARAAARARGRQRAAAGNEQDDAIYARKSAARAQRGARALRERSARAISARHAREDIRQRCSARREVREPARGARAGARQCAADARRCADARRQRERAARWQSALRALRRKRKAAMCVRSAAWHAQQMRNKEYARGGGARAARIRSSKMQLITSATKQARGSDANPSQPKPPVAARLCRHAVAVPRRA